MDTRRCDVAIIGAGSAGLAARSAAAAAGAQVLLIDAGPGGTTCARTGCMPSKLLLAAAHAADAARTAHRFGVDVGGIEIDGARVLARVRQERDRFVAGVLKGVDKLGEDEFLAGRARFDGPGVLVVDERIRIEARSIVIATGAASPIPESLQAARSRVLTNESVFEIEQLPHSLAVIGAGALGLELAQGFSRLGVRVAVFDRGMTLGGLHDPETVAEARNIFSEALDLRMETEITGAEENASGVDLRWKDAAGAAHHERFDAILAAAGRKPNLKNLGLEKSGLKLDGHGTPVFDRTTMRCGDSAVFIAGDADVERPVLHEASAEGRIAGRNAASYPELEPMPRMTPLAIVFSDPNIAAIGTSFEAAQKAGALIGTASYADQGRAKTSLRNAGLIRIYGDRQGRLLGAEMIGPAVEHTAHLLAWCIQQGLAADEVLRFPFYHPTFEEAVRTALREICTAAGLRVHTEHEVISYGPAV